MPMGTPHHFRRRSGERFLRRTPQDAPPNSSRQSLEGRFCAQVSLVASKGSIVFCEFLIFTTDWGVCFRSKATSTARRDAVRTKFWHSGKAGDRRASLRNISYQSHRRSIGRFVIDSKGTVSESRVTRPECIVILYSAFQANCPGWRSCCNWFQIGIRLAGAPGFMSH